jgi:hypothetical protein
MRKAMLQGCHQGGKPNHAPASTSRSATRFIMVTTWCTRCVVRQYSPQAGGRAHKHTASEGGVLSGCCCARPSRLEQRSAVCSALRPKDNWTQPAQLVPPFIPLLKLHDVVMRLRGYVTSKALGLGACPHPIGAQLPCLCHCLLLARAVVIASWSTRAKLNTQKRSQCTHQHKHHHGRPVPWSADHISTRRHTLPGNRTLVLCASQQRTTRALQRHSRLRTHAKCLAMQGPICTPNSISQLCGWAHKP